MPNGYSRSPKLVKGALVKLSEDFLGPIPNVIVFQYNPETISRTMTPSSASTEEGGGQAKETTAEPYDPGESFELKLELDATDALEEPEKHPAAKISGVADRISALEMLLYPVGDSLLGQLLPEIFGSGDVVPRGSVPIVLFIWGPGRVLPVRVTSFSVDEQEFLPTLYPIRATVSVGLTVLTEDSFKKLGRKLSMGEELAIKAYKYTRTQKEVLARLNLANTAESILDMLPL